MLKNFLNRSVFNKYLVSYISILLIPILIITTLVLGRFSTILEDEIREKDKSMLLFSSSNLKNEISTCHKITDVLSSIDEISPFTYSEDVYGAITLIKKLGKYSSTSSFFDKIFISFYEDDYIYSDSSAYKMNTFLNTYGSDSNIDTKLKSAFTSLSSSQLIYDDADNITYYVVPYIVNSDIVGTVGFKLNPKSIFNIVSTGTSSEVTALIDSFGNIANISDSDAIINDEYLTYLYENKDTISRNGYSLESMHGNTMFVSKIPNSNLYFLSIKSSKDLLLKLNSVKFLLLLAILITFLIATIIIRFLLNATYKPISQLNDLSKKMYKDNSNNEDYNEIEYIKSTLTYLNERNSELEYQFYENLPIRQNFQLNKLINGEIHESKEFLLECEDVNLYLSSAFHMIITVKSNDKYLSLLSLLEKYDMHIFNAEYEFLVNSDASGLSIYLVGLTSNTLSFEGKYELSKDLIVSFGAIQDNLPSVARSYIDSRNHLDFNDSSQENKNMQFFINKYDVILDDINTLFVSSNFETTFNKINYLILELNNEDLPFKLIRNVYFELVIILNSFLDKNNHLINYTSIDLTILYQMDSKESLKELFTETLNEILNLLENLNNKPAPKLSVSTIQSCIDENYTDYSFSLQLVADKFGVSLSYLSQFFKEKTGSTVLDYITTLKMDKAKELLLSTSLPLKDIAEQVGYINVSSFIRRFKQVSGMTPGEYKKTKI